MYFLGSRNMSAPSRYSPLTTDEAHNTRGRIRTNRFRPLPSQSECEGVAACNNLLVFDVAHSHENGDSPGVYWNHNLRLYSYSS
jgi:hypothetical protein